MNNPQDIELIVRFYEGDASEAERVLFAQKTIADPAFRIAAAQHQNAVEAMERLAQGAALKKMLEEEDIRLGSIENTSAMEGEGKSTKRPPAPNTRIIVWLAAAAAFAGLLFWVLQPPPPSGTAPELFAQYFHPEQMSERMKGTGSLSKDTFDLYIRYFNQHEYDRCAALFPFLPDSVKAWRKVQLYQSNVLLATGRSNEALEILRGLIDQNAPESKDARWLLALAYLQADNPEAAKNELNIFVNIANLPAREKEEASQLLKDLERIPQHRH